MKWIEACLRNRLIIYVCSVFLCVLGVVCMIRMPLAPFPGMQLNTIVIHVSYPGANAQTVNRQVTSKLMDGLHSLDNIQQMTALSQAGSSTIDLSLYSTRSVDLLQTQLEVIQAISASNLPSVVPQPQVTVERGWSTLVDYLLYSNKISLFRLNNFLQGSIVPGLTGMPQVSIQTSSSDPVIKINLNPMKIAEYTLNVSNISQLIDATYQSNPLGTLDIQNQPYILNLQNNLTTLPELNRMIVGYRHHDPGSVNTPLLGSPIYLKDIATLHFQPRNEIQDNYNSLNSQSSADIQLYTLRNANPFQVSQTAASYFAHLSLPSGVHVVKDFDMADIIGKSIHEVIFTIFVSSILVVLVGLIFLGRLKSVLMPIVTIPISLSGAFMLLYCLGFTINFISLLAMVIAVGLVVDDAIVVVENITRYLEQGMSKHEAIREGVRDIAVTVMGITATLLVVYLPVLFSNNPVADLFKPFTVTLMGAVFVSGILALSLTPLMSQSLLSDKPLNAYQVQFDAKLEKIIRGYHAGLSLILKFKKIALLIIMTLIVISMYVAFQLPKGIFPKDPDGTITIIAPGTPEDTIATLRQKMTIFKSFEQDHRVEFYGLHVRPDDNTKILTARLNLQLYPKELKQVYPLTDALNSFIKTHHLSGVYAKAENFSTWSNGYDFSFYLFGGSLGNLNQRARELTQKMKASPLFSLATNEIMEPQKQLTFEINEAKAASLGIFRQSISQLLSIDYGGYVLNNHFEIAGLSVPIVIQLGANNLSQPNSFEKLMIESPVTHQYYPLDEFVTLKMVAKPLMVVSFNGQPAVKIDANLAKGHDIEQAISQVNQWMQQDFSTTQYQFVGSALQYQESNDQALLIALVGILCVYFLLVILFRNLLDPFIIMLTVPFSMVGGMLSLYCIHGSLNLYSGLALITLVGLITKHGILIVRFANASLAQGFSVTEAILSATHHRFRPIMMTTFAMVFGALPLIYSNNVTYMARKSLGVTLVGGLLVGTFFTLILVPLVYVLCKRAKNFIEDKNSTEDTHSTEGTHSTEE